jgi:subtilisin family serine protease
MFNSLKKIMIVWVSMALGSLVACGGGGGGSGVSENSGQNAGSDLSAPPSISSQPAAASIYATQTATFTVAASGNGLLTYQWRKQGVNIPAANSSIYTTPMVALADNGALYSVVVSNAGGSTVSRDAALTVIDVAPGPVIVSQPASASLYTTQTATFTVAATGSGALTYQWRKQGINILAATSSTYTTPPATLTDNGAQFSVVVTDQNGSSASNNAALTVVEAAPGISSQPAAQSVMEGQPASFNVLGMGMPPLTYQWRKNGAAISGATSPGYTTPATAITDNGAIYTATVSNSQGSITSNNAVLSVTSNTPSITTQPTAQSVGLGQAATFSVAVTGASTLAYQWRKNGTNIIGATSSSYNLANASQSDHNALFSVVVSNSYGTVTSSNALLKISGGVNAASACGYANTSTGSDPLLPYQWHIKNNNLYFASNNPTVDSGIDLCMGGLWAAGIAGAGVTVNVVDSGLEIGHEDLSGNVLAGKSYNFVTGSTNPTNSATTGDHGTSVAGLIAASKGNTLGGSGVSPSASLVGYNYVSAQSLLSLGRSFGADTTYHASNSDIFNYSAGNTSSSLGSVDSASEAVILNMLNLRSAKGGIFVKSAGNGFAGGGVLTGTTYCLASGVTCQSANQDTGNKHYNAIVVASLNADGNKSSYSTTGSSIWVSGFGGEYGRDVSVVGSGLSSVNYKPAMVTTDQSSCAAGYSRATVNKNALDKGDGTGTSNPNCSYTAGFNGTSSAAPTVSGVIALMLQANPALTWRDVRHILASTSRRVNPAQAPITNTSYFGSSVTLEQGWVLNAGGFWYHNWYGFGLVNAAAAVAMAQSYLTGVLGNFVSESSTAALGVTTVAPLTATGLTKTFSMAGASPSIVEQAELTLYVGSGYVPSCTQIELSSPQGTKSIVLNADSAHMTASTSGVKFMSNAFYGEPASGTWTLRLVNVCNTAQALSTTLPQQLTIRGRTS